MTGPVNLRVISIRLWMMMMSLYQLQQVSSVQQERDQFENWSMWHSVQYCRLSRPGTHWVLLLRYDANQGRTDTPDCRMFVNIGAALHDPWPAKKTTKKWHQDTDISFPVSATMSVEASRSVCICVKCSNKSHSEWIITDHQFKTRRLAIAKCSSDQQNVNFVLFIDQHQKLLDRLATTTLMQPQPSPKIYFTWGPNPCHTHRSNLPKLVLKTFNGRSNLLLELRLYND